MRERPRLLPSAAEFLGISERSLGERARLRQVPHRRPPYSRKLLFWEGELRAWPDGCELECKELAGAGRVVRPIPLPAHAG